MANPKSTIGKLSRKPTAKLSKKSSAKDDNVSKKINGPFKLLAGSILVLKNNWRLFSSIFLVYCLLSFIFVNSLSFSSNSEIAKITNSNSGSLSKSSSLLGSVLNNSPGNSSNTSSGIYQMILWIIISLAIIYCLREVYAKNKIRARDGFYKGMYPLVPTLIIAFIIALELLPLVLGSMIFAYFFSGLITVNIIVKFIVCLVSGGLWALTFYLLATSLIAFYIATVPNMTPWQSLKLAGQMVKKRRIAVFGRIIFMAVALVLIFIVVTLPVAMISKTLIIYTEFFLALVLLFIFHSYMYLLYRELI